MLMHYFLNLCLLFVLWLGCLTAQAQNFPVYNSFYVNPYLYNPAEALTEYTQVYAIYRQQWTNVEGAPTLATVSINTLMNDSKVGLGGKISSYKRGLLTSTDVTLTYAFGMPVGQKNWLFFGLSGGAISNSVDVTSATNGSGLPFDPSTDPALNVGSNIQPSANFGMLYRSGSGLNFGFSLPQLFPPSYNTATLSNTTVSPADNVFVTLYYKKKIESKIVSRRKGNVRKKIKTEEKIAPLEFYLNYKYSKFGNSQFEFLGKLNLSQNFWLGGSYRLPYGFTGNMGIVVKRFTFSYSYEPGSQPENGFSQGTHEVLLGLRLGKSKRFKRPEPVLRSTLKQNPAEKHTARFQESVEDPNDINKTQEAAPKKRYFVVIRVFADFNAADSFRKKLIGDKYNANIFYNPQDRKYYVHVLETEKASEGHEEVRNLKTYTKLKEARLLIVNTPK